MRKMKQKEREQIVYIYMCVYILYTHTHTMISKLLMVDPSLWSPRFHPALLIANA